MFNGSNTGNVLVRDIEDGSGTIAYVTSSGVNNGVVAYIDASKYSIIKGNCILVGGKTFTLTYQANDFVSNDSHNIVIHLKNAHRNEYIYLYLISAIKAMLNKKYSWGDAVTKDKLLNDSILLPSTANGEPDFEYMEQYMRNIEKRVQAAMKDVA